MSTLSELLFCKTKYPKELLEYDGREALPSITSTGAVGANAIWEDSGYVTGVLAVPRQRNAYYCVAAGVITSESDRNTLIDMGLKAFEWGFGFQGVLYDFPLEKGGSTTNQSYFHHKAMFMEHAARSMLLIKEADDVDAAYVTRVNTLITKLANSVSWMASTYPGGDLDDFMRETVNSNQIGRVASVFRLAYFLTGTASFNTMAQTVTANWLARQTADGTIPESLGFDTVYQSLSLELLTRQIMHVTDTTYKSTLFPYLMLGLEKWLPYLSADGIFDVSENTRTTYDGDPVEGAGPKGRNIDIYPIRLYYYAYLLCDQCPYDRVAMGYNLDSRAMPVELHGQAFTHISKLDEDDQ